MTMGLWGYEWREDGVDADGEELGHYELDEGTRWEWWRVVLRVVTTPVTVVGDCVAGIGESLVSFDWLFDDDEGDACQPRAASASSGRSGSPRPASGGKPIVTGLRASR